MCCFFVLHCVQHDQFMEYFASGWAYLSYSFCRKRWVFLFSNVSLKLLNDKILHHYFFISRKSLYCEVKVIRNESNIFKEMATVKTFFHSFAVCGELNTSENILESPNYPMNYTNNLKCSWKIRAQKGKVFDFMAVNRWRHWKWRLKSKQLFWCRKRVSACCYNWILKNNCWKAISCYTILKIK